MSSGESEWTGVVASDAQLSTTVDGEEVVLGLESNTYYGLSGVAPHIWAQIQEPTTVEAVVEHIVEEYGVDRSQCEADTVRFLESLAEAGLVEQR